MHRSVAEDSDTDDLANRKLTGVKGLDGSADLKTGTWPCCNCLGQSDGDETPSVDKADENSGS